VNYEFAIKWMKCFRESSELICALYDDEAFDFSDPMLDQHNVNAKPDLLRLFELYANKDRANGLGIHNFRVRGYVGDDRSGLILWQWEPEDCAMFIGMDAAGKPFGTQGHTYHEYNEDGKIVFESSWWDASAVLRALTPELPGHGPASPTKSPTGQKQMVSA
jgi:steroid delta-isomerase-like uncharacterized protein